MLLGSGAFHHPLCILDEVLAVGVEGHGVRRGGVAQDVVEAGPEGRPLALVEHVSQDRGPGRVGQVRRAVSRSVVDAHDVVEGLEEVGDGPWPR